MLPSKHFFASCIAILALWPFFGFWSLFIIAGGFFIDVDHYIRYALVKKDLSLYRAYYYHKNRKKGHDNSGKGEIYIFHTIETLIALSIFSFFHQLFFMALLGWIIHMAMDIFYDIKNHNKIKYPSFIFFAIKNNYKNIYKNNSV